MKSKNFTEMEIDSMVEKIAEYINEGHSISRARKLAIGSRHYLEATELVMDKPAYCEALNAYMKRIGKPIQYDLVNGLLKYRRVA